jgi:hypothetical protein
VTVFSDVRNEIRAGSTKYKIMAASDPPLALQLSHRGVHEEAAQRGDEHHQPAEHLVGARQGLECLEEQDFAGHVRP